MAESNKEGGSPEVVTSTWPVGKWESTFIDILRRVHEAIYKVSQEKRYKPSLVLLTPEVYVGIMRLQNLEDLPSVLEFKMSRTVAGVRTHSSPSHHSGEVEFLYGWGANQPYGAPGSYLELGPVAAQVVWRDRDWITLVVNILLGRVPFDSEKRE